MSVGRGWAVLTAVVSWAVFLQAITAGRLMRGDDWARSLHRSAAGLLFLVTLGAGLVAFAVLRDRVGGRRLATVLVALGVALFVQHGLGTAAADGSDTLWLHVPLGVAVVGASAQANVLARRLQAEAGAAR